MDEKNYKVNTTNKTITILVPKDYTVTVLSEPEKTAKKTERPENPFSGRLKKIFKDTHDKILADNFVMKPRGNWYLCHKSYGIFYTDKFDIRIKYDDGKLKLMAFFKDNGIFETKNDLLRYITNYTKDWNTTGGMQIVPNFCKNDKIPFMTTFKSRKLDNCTNKEIVEWCAKYIELACTYLKDIEL